MADREHLLGFEVTAAGDAHPRQRDPGAQCARRAGRLGELPGAPEVELGRVELAALVPDEAPPDERARAPRMVVQSVAGGSFEDPVGELLVVGQLNWPGRAESPRRGGRGSRRDGRQNR